MTRRGRQSKAKPDAVGSALSNSGNAACLAPESIKLAGAHSRLYRRRCYGESWARCHIGSPKWDKLYFDCRLLNRFQLLDSFTARLVADPSGNSHETRRQPPRLTQSAHTGSTCEAHGVVVHLVPNRLCALGSRWIICNLRLRTVAQSPFAMMF